MRLILALVALLMPTLALGQTLPSPAMRGDNITVTPSGASTGRSLPSRFAERINLRDYGAVGNGTTDDSSALDAAVLRANTLRSAGTFACIYLPPGQYLITTAPRSFVGPGCVMGDGPQRSYLKLATAFSGTLFQWSESWMGNAYLSSNRSVGVGPAPGRTGTTTTAGITGQLAGATLTGFAVIGDRGASAAQHAFAFYDRNDYVTIRDVDCHYVPGRCLYAGATRDQTQGYLRESRIVGFRAFASGAPGFPVIDMTSVGNGDATNEVALDLIDIYAPGAEGLVLRGSNGLTNSTRYIRMGTVRIEGDQGNPAGLSVPLMRIGDSSSDGRVGSITCLYCELGSPYAGSYALELQPAVGRGAASPSSISITGRIFTGGGTGGGVNIAGGTSLSLHLSGLSSAGTNLAVASSTTVAGPIILNGNGNEAGWTYNIDATSLASVNVPLRTSGDPSSGGTLTAPAASFAALTIGTGGINVAGGGVASITFTSLGSYAASTGIPVITIAAPSAGGTRATASVTGMKFSQLVGGTFLTGAGCSVNDILTMQGGTYDTPFAFRVTAVDGSGKPTGQTASGGGSTTGTYTVLAPDTSTWTGGTCTTAPTARMAYVPGTWTITSPGSGYATNTTFTATTSGLGTAAGTAQVNVSLPLTAAAGAVTMDSSGTTLGVSGTSGAPVLAQAVVIDRTGVRQSLGTTYTVPRNVSLVRFIQGTTVATATVTLPTAYADGQVVQFVNYAGSVTALTFSPTVNGWTNASTLSANTGLRVRWDATAAAWYREQ